MDGVAIECGIKLPLWFCFCFFHLVSTEDRCRTLDFREYYPDSAFNKSIIQNLTVDSEDNCQVACFIQPACKSYNLGPPDGQGKRVCELSSSRHFSHSLHLVSRPSFIYRPSVDWCQSPCPDNKTCFPDDAAGYSCWCTDPGFQGERCDEDINECSTGAHDCASDAQCTNNVGSFTCTCKDGFEGNGKTCQDTDECLQAQHDCDVTATCQNTIGSFVCNCPPGNISDGKACADFPFHWTFNDTDRFLTLQGAASFEVQDGRTVLYLDGTTGTYAETPALAFQQTDLTIAVWIKRFPASPSSRPVIYGDWSSPHQFRFDVSGNGRLCVDVRRESSVVNGLLNFCTPVNTVPANEWSHVVFTWGRVQHTGKLYINGVERQSQVANISTESIVDLKNSGHTVYDIGLRRGSGNTIHAYFSDLMIFNRELSESEIKNNLFLNHQLKTFSTVPYIPEND